MKLALYKEIIQMALDSLRSNKLRSFLTVLGITIGVSTVIGMVSIIQGLNRTFLQELESVGSDIIIVAKYEPGIFRVGRGEEEIRRRKNLTFEDAQAIEEECPSIRAVAVNLMVDPSRDFPVKYQNRQSEETLILGMNDRFPEVLSVYRPKKGRFIIASDILHSSSVCVLGFDVAETLFPHQEPLGKEIRIGPEKFRVVGVLERRGSIFGQSRDNFVGLPISTLMKYFPYDLNNLEIIAVPRSHELLPEAIEEITSLLRRRRKVGFGQPNDFAVYTQEAIINLYNQITGAAYLVMIVISSIGLLVGGIGVMNIMLVAAKERTREIGIRKAIGARPRDISRQFLIESVVLTLFGGLMGLLLGSLIALIVKAITPLPASITLWSVLLGVGVSIGVGLFFGLWPARKAALLDPIICLRYE
ncbi:MAG: ABC transporter permease [Candidatus Aminicenantes bacterium]|nr:ABC transporter permease [Candidatus Aminicenantes bacterium]